jgi:hypothetical protein
MVMRYHWDLAAGHIYARGTSVISEPEMLASNTTVIPSVDTEPETSSGSAVGAHTIEEENQNNDDPELGFENRQDDFIEEAENIDGEDDLVEEGVNFDVEQGTEDDDELLAMDDMYGPPYE